MRDAIISVENLGKKYRISHQGERQRYVALRDVIAEKFKGLFQNRKSEIGNRKSNGSAGVPPAPFGDSPKETTRQSPGATPAEGNRDGRAPQTSVNRKSEIGNRKSNGSTGVSPVISGGSPEIPAGLSTINSQPSTASDSSLVPRNSTEDFWALKDVSFEVKRGEVVGIIGRNGAGKSTLLKILSRITEPTTGRVTLRGRVASLLEVGTGFHPELTGRENVFLNGAILGMSRAEIRKKFDEIVAFAEVEKFLDTPVKRYSSGMYVRLAFAVAAHLEPEILIVDEVLAVGDAEFQKKCLGKMQDVAKGGRTVLFVSHNMGVIRNLCPRVVLLENGRSVFFGLAQEGMQKYLSAGGIERTIIRKLRSDGRPTITMASIEIVAEAVPELLLMLQVNSEITASVSIEIKLIDGLGIPVGFASVGLLDSNALHILPGIKRLCCRLQVPMLSRGNYRVAVQLAVPFVEVIDSIGDGIFFHFDRAASNGKQRVPEQIWGYGSFEIPMVLSTMEKM
jgi:lipopolysaccharide transport system ATP-binding protein